MSLEAKLLSKIQHQMETFHNDSLKYWAVQSKNNEKLNRLEEQANEIKAKQDEIMKRERAQRDGNSLVDGGP